MSVTYKITPSEFGWLSQVFAQKNAISPFSSFEKHAPSFDEAAKADLISQGVIAEDGTIQSSAFAALQVLAQAEAYSRIRVLGVEAPVDKVTYFKGKSACAVDSGNGGFTVAFPAMSKEAGFVMEEFTGSSRLINVPFAASLSPKAALAFLTLVDQHRTLALLALAGKPKEAGISAHQVRTKANSNGSYLSFTTSLKNLVGLDSLAPADISVALGELVERKLAEERDGNYYLTGDALELANTLLIPEYVFNISSGRMLKPDTAEHSECYVLFCGMHNLLYIDTDRGMVTIETMSGSDLLGIMMNSLSEPPAKR